MIDFLEFMKAYGAYRRVCIIKDGEIRNDQEEAIPAYLRSGKKNTCPHDLVVKAETALRLGFDEPDVVILEDLISSICWESFEIIVRNIAESLDLDFEELIEIAHASEDPRDKTLLPPDQLLEKCRKKS
jgi:hypothetical protein